MRSSVNLRFLRFLHVCSRILCILNALWGEIHIPSPSQCRPLSWSEANTHYPLTNFDESVTVFTMRDATVSQRELNVRERACCDGAELLPELPDLPEADALAERLKALADPTRLRMLDLLTQRDAPLCVCEITERFPLHQPTISHHLRILRQAGLIAGEKRSVWSYYSATDDGRRSLALAKSLM